MGRRNCWRNILITLIEKLAGKRHRGRPHIPVGTRLENGPGQTGGIEAVVWLARGAQNAPRLPRTPPHWSLARAEAVVLG